MRVMVIMRASEQTEAGVAAGAPQLAEMGRYDEELVKAGAMLAGERLHPSSGGVRVRLSAGGPTVVDGPSGAPGELVAGFWLWQVKSFDEAVEWARRCPRPPGGDAEIEIRRVVEPEQFGTGTAPTLREGVDSLRAASASN